MGQATSRALQSSCRRWHAAQCSNPHHNLPCPPARPHCRASVSLACKTLYEIVLSAGGCRCNLVGHGCNAPGKHLASFGAWLDRLQAAGGCAGLAVRLQGDEVSADDALATLRQVGAVGPTKLHVDSSFSWRLDRAQQLRAAEALGASVPCRLRTLRMSLGATALPALHAVTTLQSLKFCILADEAWQWRPNLPQLTALQLVFEGELSLSLDGVPALKKIVLDFEDDYNCAAIITAGVALDSLTAVRFCGGELSFPWQQASGLRELAVHAGPLRPPSMPGTRDLTALKELHALALELPRNELPARAAWLGSVTALETHITRHERQDAIDQVGGWQGPMHAC